MENSSSRGEERRGAARECTEDRRGDCQVINNKEGRAPGGMGTGMRVKKR